MFSLGDQGEPSSNKKTDVDANKASNTFFPTVKAVFDWVSGLFVKGAPSSVDNAIPIFDGATGKLLQNSGVIITDGAVLQSGETVATSGSVLLQAKYNNYPAQAIGTEYSTGGIGFLQYMYQGGGSQWKSSFHAGSIGRAALFLNTSELKLLAAPVQSVDPGEILTTQPTVKFQVSANGDVSIYGQIIDNVGSSGVDGQVLKKVGGLVLWSNP